MPLADRPPAKAIQTRWASFVAGAMLSEKALTLAYQGEAPAFVLDHQQRRLLQASREPHSHWTATHHTHRIIDSDTPRRLSDVEYRPG